MDQRTAECICALYLLEYSEADLPISRTNICSLIFRIPFSCPETLGSMAALRNTVDIAQCVTARSVFRVFGILGSHATLDNLIGASYIVEKVERC